jgi:hypothetical protein
MAEVAGFARTNLTLKLFLQSAPNTDTHIWD